LHVALSLDFVIWVCLGLPYVFMLA